MGLQKEKHKLRDCNVRFKFRLVRLIKRNFSHLLLFTGRLGYTPFKSLICLSVSQLKVIKVNMQNMTGELRVEIQSTARLG